jgi:hypothetical protein
MGDSGGLGSLNTTAGCTKDVMAITKVRFLAAARTGKNRSMIYGPRSDGTYIVEFETAALGQDHLTRGLGAF